MYILIQRNVQQDVDVDKDNHDKNSDEDRTCDVHTDRDTLFCHEKDDEEEIDNNHCKREYH